MKFLSCLTITIALSAPVLAQTPAPIPTVAETQAKQELNEAARAYRDGNFAEAQVHAERAVLLDPQNKTASYFLARTIHAQYRPGNSTPENLAKAQEAIMSYQRVLERSPGDDEAYKAIAYLYGALKEDELLRQWILQRASDVSLTDDKRAEAFIVLASKDWDCSFQITEQPTVKIATVDGSKMHVRYRKPKDQAEFERAKECSNRGLEMANMAITLTPENESAWSYKTNILLELEKLAEMVGDMHQKSELHQQYEEALSQTNKLSKRPEPNP